MSRLLFVIAVVLAASLAGPAQAFVSNDLIPSSFRVQFNNERTAWTPIFGKACPRFGQDRTVKIVLPLDTSGGTDYKIQFSFNNDQFLTSWITVMATSENIISFAEFTLVYTGGAIVEVQHKAHHWPKETAMEIKQLKDRQLTLHWKWDHLKENDATIGLSVLFISGFVVAGTTLVISLLAGDKKRRRHAPTHVKTPSFSSGAPPVGASAGLGSGPAFGSDNSYYNYGNSSTSSSRPAATGGQALPGFTGGTQPVYPPGASGNADAPAAQPPSGNEPHVKNRDD